MNVKRNSPQTKIERLLQMESLLLAHPEGLSSAEIARRLKVNQSTVMRDVASLKGRIPVVFQRSTGKLCIDRRDSYWKSVAEYNETRIIKRIANLIARGESSNLEFKVAACWNDYKQTKDRALIQNVIRTVASFANSETGGTLLIGVADDGTITGLAKEYEIADTNKQNRDGYELFLRNSLNDTLGADCILLYEITFHQLDGKEICRIEVKPSDKPIFLQGELYVRNGNQTSRLTTQEAMEYIQKRWN